MGRLQRRLAGWTCLLLCLGGTRAAGQQEPYWNSRPLSYWMKALTTQDPIAREQGANSVREIAIAHGGGAAAQAVPLLLPNLGHDLVAVRESTAAALEQIGPPAHAAVPTLLTLLQRDPAPRVRRKAALALGRIDPAATPVVTAAGAALHGDADSLVRVSAAVLLLAAGPASRAVAPALRASLAESDSSLRLYAAAALVQGGDRESALAIVRESLRAEDLGVRVDAAGLLASLAPADAATLPALAAALEDDDAQVRTAVVDAMGALGRAARPFLPSLWPLIRDRDEDVREHVIRAIRRIRD